MLTTVFRQTTTGLRLLIVLTLLCGVGYPLPVWGVAQLPGLADRADGSVLTAADGRPAGSRLIGVDPVPADPAADPWFHTRPAASASDVLGPADTATSGGSNKGGFDADLLDAVTKRRELIAAREGVPAATVPPDAVTASASGLDPDISPDYAALQANRVARVAGLPLERVQQLIAQASSGRILGFLGEPVINVTELNLAMAAARR